MLKKKKPTNSNKRKTYDDEEESSSTTLSESAEGTIIKPPPTKKSRISEKSVISGTSKQVSSSSVYKTPSEENSIVSGSSKHDISSLFSGADKEVTLDPNQEQIVARGPTKSAANIKTTCRFDYQPDVCKDYKETGYCSFGSDCKFAHIREDYLSGWELEKKWEEEQENKAKQPKKADKEEDEDTAIPFACFICREKFTLDKTLVVTQCGHYFCEECAMEFFHEASSKCFVCGKETNGVFLTATKLINKLKKLEEKKKAISFANEEEDAHHSESEIKNQKTEEQAEVAKDEEEDQLLKDYGDYQDKLKRNKEGGQSGWMV